MTKLHQIHLAKKSLAAMPEAERKLLLLLGHAINEINVFQKLVLMSGQGNYTPAIVDYVQAGQTLILMRTLIGKLHEAWDMFHKRVLCDKLVQAEYLPRLDDEATAALSKLKKHFGTRSPLTQIRNGFSFHYRDDEDLVEKSFQEIPDDEEWHFILSNVQGNCFHYASELVVQSAMIKLADKAQDDTESFHTAAARRFETLCDLTILVSGLIQTLFLACIAEIVSYRLPEVNSVDLIELAGLIALSERQIPFFVDDMEFKPKA
jgi:hypothetical protein